jgi:hypothetical protein
MANTTFNGAVRSENGFQVISKAAGTGVETTNLTIDANGSITTNVLGINLKPTLAGQTVTAKATATSVTYVAGINTNDFAGSAAQTVTLPAATVGTVCIHAQSVQCGGGTAALVFDCAGTDVFATGSVIPSTGSAKSTFDVSTAGETKLTLTPTSAQTNLIGAASYIYFTCTTAGVYNISTDFQCTGAGTTGVFAFAA